MLVIDADVPGHGTYEPGTDTFRGVVRAFRRNPLEHADEVIAERMR